MPYKHVLAATDFSEMGDRALRHAATMCGQSHANLSLLHVIDATPVPNPLYGHYSIVTDEEGQRRAIDRARELLEERLQAVAAGAKAQCLVRVGDATDEILDCAKDVNADLIVLATHGRRGVKRLVLGSVAERVVRLATASVLIVR